MKYRPEIDGLRAVAVLPVILFHAGFGYFSGGYVGVDIFFVISGYLITTILINELDAGKFSIARFYERRARRILPALLLVMLVCLPAAWFIMLPAQLEELGWNAMAVSLFVSNIALWLNTDYSLPLPNSTLSCTLGAWQSRSSFIYFFHCCYGPCGGLEADGHS